MGEYVAKAEGTGFDPAASRYSLPIMIEIREIRKKRASSLLLIPGAQITNRIHEGREE